MLLSVWEGVRASAELVCCNSTCGGPQEEEAGSSCKETMWFEDV